MHKKLTREVETLGGRISGFFFCPYLSGPDRKPQPGLLKDIASRAHVELKGIPFIGDTMRDIEAAIAVDAEPILVLTGKGEVTLNSGEVPDHVKVYEDLYDVAEHLLKDNK